MATNLMDLRDEALAALPETVRKSGVDYDALADFIIDAVILRADAQSGRQEITLSRYDLTVPDRGPIWDDQWRKLAQSVD